MAEVKTRPTGEDADAFLAAIPDDRRRSDARTICKLLARVTGDPAVMWGKAMVGFGLRYLHYDSGRELDTLIIGLSPRKTSTTLHLPDGCATHADLLARLGPHTTRGSCLYIKRLADVDAAVLEDLVTRSVTAVRTSPA